MEKRCKDCRWWKRDNDGIVFFHYGTCNHPAIADSSRDEIPVGGINAAGGMIDELYTDESFGCVHFGEPDEEDAEKGSRETRIEGRAG